MNKEDYMGPALEFRAMILAEAAKPERERNFPDEWMRIEVIATCHTPGCPRDGFSHKIWISEPADGIYRVLCAPCNRAIEDLDPMFDDDPEFRLNTRADNGDLGVEGE